MGCAMMLDAELAQVLEFSDEVDVRTAAQWLASGWEVDEEAAAAIVDAAAGWTATIYRASGEITWLPVAKARAWGLM